MVRIGFPLCGFASACDDDARAMTSASVRHFDGGSKMHRECHGTNNSVGTVHQSHELTCRCFADQIGHSFERRVPMSRFAALQERDSTAEVIDNFLIARRVPPLGREIEFATRHHDPVVVRERNLQIVAGGSLPFGSAEVDISGEFRDRDSQAELFFEVLRVAVQKVVRALIALVDQRVVHVEHFDTRHPFIQPGQPGIVLP